MHGPCTKIYLAKHQLNHHRRQRIAVWVAVCSLRQWLSRWVLFQHSICKSSTQLRVKDGQENEPVGGVLLSKMNGELPCIAHENVAGDEGRIQILSTILLSLGFVLHVQFSSKQKTQTICIVMLKVDSTPWQSPIGPKENWGQDGPGTRTEHSALFVNLSVDSCKQPEAIQMFHRGTSQKTVDQSCTLRIKKEPRMREQYSYNSLLCPP